MRDSLLVLGGACVLGCCPAAEQRTFQVSVALIGEESSFTGRTIRIQGKTAPTAYLDRPVSTDLGMTVYRTSVTLCTTSSKDFYETPISVSVEGNGQTIETSIERVACRLSPDRAKGEHNVETNTVWLLPDGSIDAEFGDRPSVEATCGVSGANWSCDEDEL
jgi:hypothetical protein